MAQQNQVSMPGPFGGLVRYDAETGSRFKLTPTQVFIFIAIVILGVIAMNIFF